jgi:7,8-dihydropterin-6-yl-methyl-4-(beta-D-ribofuranosyl)aminobenzene 5'-phosphate synthase
MSAEQLRNELPELAALDGAEVFVLVDNVSDALSSVPEGVTSEFDILTEAGAECFSGDGFCFACFGISLVVSARIGDRVRTVLFDGGPTGLAVEYNVPRLGIDMGVIEAVVLSHGHIDHAGGLPAAIRLISAANDGQWVSVHVNPEMFLHRGERLDDGSIFPLEDIPTVEALEQAGGEVKNDPEAQLLLDNMFFLSGEIPRTTSYEKGIPVQVKRNAFDADWEPDPWVMDERYLAVNVRNKGILVFTACSHAGLINVLRDARDKFSPTPLYGVMGGFHLAGKIFEAIIPETVRDLEEFDLKVIVPGHCTGWRAVHHMVDAFGDAIVVPSAVGRRHLF